MKRSVILISVSLSLLFLLSLSLSAQEISGTYFEGADSLSFNENHIKFRLKGNDALGVIFTGEGKYEIIEDYIVINTETYSGPKTKIEVQNVTKSDTIKLKLIDEDGFTIRGVRAEFLNKKGKSIGLSISDDNGEIRYKANPKITAISVSDLLYDKTIIDYQPHMHYTLHLIKSKVLENNTVILKLEERTENLLKIKLLSTDYKRETPSDSQLKKLDKKTKNIIDRFRSFKKPEHEDDFL